MEQSNAGSVRLMNVFGIQVFVHWTWFLVAVIELQLRAGNYSSPIWNVAEYLTLFGIVLLHEFGHSLACRSVGGKADRIILWPLGGIAFVSPPPRPGAVLWSIAAGPLVNLVLVPVTFGLAFAFDAAVGLPLPPQNNDLQHYIAAVTVLNLFLLCFNMLPIYPLDGGQVLQSLLWFVIGRWRALQVVSVLGLLLGGLVLAGALAFIVFLRAWNFIFLALIAAFIMHRSVLGFQQAQALLRLQQFPRLDSLRCPACREAAPRGLALPCPRCGTPFQPFEDQGRCPACGVYFDAVPCVYCGHLDTLDAWAGRETARET